MTGVETMIIPVLPWWGELPILLPIYLAVAAMLSTIIGQKWDNYCDRAVHRECSHGPTSWVIGMSFPVSIPVLMVVGMVAGTIFLGSQMGAVPAIRRERMAAAKDAAVEYRQAQRQAVEDRLEREAYGTKECKYCQHEVFRNRGVWRSVKGGQQHCESYSNPTRAHQIPDELDVVKKEPTPDPRAEEETGEEDDVYIAEPIINRLAREHERKQRTVTYDKRIR